MFSRLTKGAVGAYDWQANRPTPPLGRGVEKPAGLINATDRRGRMRRGVAVD